MFFSPVNVSYQNSFVAEHSMLSGDGGRRIKANTSGTFCGKCKSEADLTPSAI